MEHRNDINLSLFIQLAKVQDMFKIHRQDREHPKNAQFNIYMEQLQISFVNFDEILIIM